MMRRNKRCLPIETDSSEDETVKKPRLNFSTSSPHTSNGPDARYRCITRKSNRIPISTSEESSISEADEIVRPPRQGCLRPLSDYDSCSSSNSAGGSSATQALNRVNEHDSISSSCHNIVKKSRRKRFVKIRSSSSEDSSDSEMPVRFQRRKKRMKLCSSSSGNSSESSIGDINSASSSVGRVQTMGDNSSRVVEYTTDAIGDTFNGMWQMSDDDGAFRLIQMSNDVESSSDDDIRPQFSRIHSRRVLQSTSSSDSEDEIPIRIPKNRRAAKPIIESDDDVKKETLVESLSETDDTAEVCPICLNRFYVQLVGKPSNCEHIFCYTCITEWAKNSNTCPVDRQQFSSIKVLTSINGSFLEEVPVFNVQRMYAEEPEDPFESDYSLWSQSEDESSLYMSDEGDECCVCHSGSTRNDMLYCDVCYSVYHLRCVDPPIRNFPVGSWSCASCVS